MNEVFEPIYLDLLDKGKFDTEETTSIFYKAYDYIVDIAECEDNVEEKDRQRSFPLAVYLLYSVVFYSLFQ